MKAIIIMPMILLNILYMVKINQIYGIQEGNTDMRNIWTK